ncbi:baseplate J/gp47 family protein [Frankia sp. QA3]|uniref:baseplate J/gp47 family protein n=1 Tax=Frankia sp. QA3 TaxID=710111 RepID=UPI000269BEF8|nr:baseplate J/gp47 family protein [Frankia sp. QA3]EIV92708.1 putative phage Mu protein gp47-like protein [Frankia sp. QA3]
MFTARTYPDIVAEVLVAVTQGVVGDVLTVPGVVPDGHLFFLPRRPVRRLSLVSGVVEAPDGSTTPWRFTDADWELVSSTGRPEELDALRFRPRRPRPAGGSVLRVSYWPRDVPAVPLTDLGVGSVTRTLLETLAREIADAEAQLQIVYDSAFVDTAEGRALDRVVALLGIERRQADVPVGKVRLLRRPGTAGLVTVPVGTVVMSAQGARYLTTREATLRAGESSVEVGVAGEARTTPLVGVGELERPALSLAGVDRVTNEAPTFQPTGPEEDDALRARARRAFHGVGLGTLDALTHGLGGLDGVTGVQVTEFPDGKPGTIAVDVALTDPDDPDAVAAVAATIERLRPAGIRIVWQSAAQVEVVVDVTRLVLTGGNRPVAELEDVRAGLTRRLTTAISELPPGGRLAAPRVAALALADDRIADLDLTFTLDGEAGRAEVALPAGKSAHPVTPIALPPPRYTDVGAPGPQVRLQVRVIGPVQLIGTTTLAAATDAIRTRTLAWLAAATLLDFTAFAAAVRDDTAYALVLEEVAVVLERDGRFEQLVLGSPSRPVDARERPKLAGVELGARS